MTPRLAPLASLVALALLVLALAGLLAHHALFARGPVALAVQGAAVLLLLWARLTFGLRSFHAAADPTAGGLVTRGPYAFLRHPIYAAILWFVWAGVLSNLDAAGVALAVLATAMTAVRIATEEKLLRAAYPGYAAYAARTRRVIPFVL